MSNVVLGLVSATILFAVFHFWRYLKNVLRSRKLVFRYPGPPQHPLLGNVFDFGNTSEILDQTMNFKQKYGRAFRVSLTFNDHALVVSDPKFLEFLLSSQKLITKSEDYRFLHEWLGTGLLTSTGAKWKLRRRIITPTFHFQILEQFIDGFNTAGDVLVEKLRGEIGKDSTNVYPFITLCALDIICETAMGTSVNAQQDSKSEYVHSVKEMCRILIERAFSLVKSNEFLYRFTGDFAKGKRAVKVLHDYTDDVIRRRRTELDAKGDQESESDEIMGAKKRHALLDVLLKSNVDGKPLSHEDIREEVDTLMFEGHDTTASAMSFTVFCLANNKHVQDKVVEELRDIFGDDKTRPPTYDDLKNMKYLTMVIQETLRLYPSVPMYGRNLEADVEYEGTVLPKGLTLSIFAYGVHRDPEIWPEPEKFDPDRFLPENSAKRSPYAYIPFSAGPRNCVGQKFAMLEMKATISKILRNFELLPTEPEHKLVLTAETVLKSANGIKVRIVKRRNF